MFKAFVRLLGLVFPILLLLLFAPIAAVAADFEQGIAVLVNIQGDMVHVEAELMIEASTQQVWDVLTDFAHLPQFLSNITASKILARQGNSVRVGQAGTTHVGPLAFRFQSEREITLTPYTRFESRQLTGNMKSFHGITQLDSEGDVTRIRYRAEAVPDTVLPLSMGKSLIESETREHYLEIRKEVLRRKALGGIE